MSKENVEIARRALEAALRRPKPDYDSITALYHPDHKLVSLVQRLEGGVAEEGARGYRDFLTEMDDAWEWWDTKVEQIRIIDRDRVLADGVFTALSKRGGVPMEQSITWIVTVREGKLARTEFYGSREQALEAAGISD